MAGDKAVAWCRGLQAVLESLGLLVGEVLLPAVRVVAVGEELARLVTSFLTRLAGVEEVLSLLPSDLTKYNVAKCTTSSICHRRRPQLPISAYGAFNEATSLSFVSDNVRMVVTDTHVGVVARELSMNQEVICQLQNMSRRGTIEPFILQYFFICKFICEYILTITLKHNG